MEWNIPSFGVVNLLQINPNPNDGSAIQQLEKETMSDSDLC